MKTVYLSLGSNLGDRRANVENAIARLASEKLRVIRQSSIYETEPRDVPGQPWFLNLIVEAETDLFPRQLLARAKNIERALGRRPSTPKGPRLIDIDIILFGHAVISLPDLEIPHPRMAERRFVLEPLHELAPEIRHPTTSHTVREMLAKLSGQTVRRL